MAFRPSSDMLESDIRSAIDSGNKIEDDVGGDCDSEGTLRL